MKVVCFAFGAFCAREIFSSKKINILEIVLITSFHYITNILIYGISYKTLTSKKPWCIRFDERDGHMIVLAEEFRHLVLFDYGLFNKICDKTKYLVSKKVVLQIVVIMKSELIHIILYLLKKYLLFILL